MTHVPLDVWREILLGLPSKSVIRFRAVCKTWLSMIDDPCFVRAHTNKQQLSSNTTTILIRGSTGPPSLPLYSVDLETLNSSSDGHHKLSATSLNNTRSELFRLKKLYNVASCNGLMLIAPKGPSKNWEIWNPLTHERLELPQRNFSRWIKAYGLGYDSANDDYKAVVIIDCESCDFSKKLTHVYSLKLDSWRKIVDYPGKRTYGSPGVFLGGALHWISSSSSDGHAHGKIIALDLGTESYRELKMPPCRVLNEYDYHERLQCQELDLLSGCLAVSDAAKDDFFDLWVRMDYGAEDSWTKQEEGRSFYLFDIVSGSVKMVSIHGLCGRLTAQAFHGTIFRLHDNCGVSGRRRRKRKIPRKSNCKTKMADKELTYRVVF